MTVRELIQLLDAMPDEAPVRLVDDEVGHHYDVESVELMRNGTVEIY